MYPAKETLLQILPPTGGQGACRPSMYMYPVLNVDEPLVVEE
jgi:hypothetical protein